jgi:hypothetical protein
MEFAWKVFVWFGEHWKLVLYIAPFVGLAFMYGGFVPTLTRGYYRLKEAFRLMFTTPAGFVIGVIVLLVWAYFNYWYTQWIPK